MPPGCRDTKTRRRRLPWRSWGRPATRCAASGNVVKLKLAATDSAKAITYLVDRKWDIKNLLYGQNGIAALTFCDVMIDQ